MPSDLWNRRCNSLVNKMLANLELAKAWIFLYPDFGIDRSFKSMVWAEKIQIRHFQLERPILSSVKKISKKAELATLTIH